MMPRDALAGAGQAMAKGDAAAAERLYRQALAAERSQAAVYGLGTLLLATGRNREALPLLREAADGAASLPASAALLSCLAALGQWDAARSMADGLLRMHSTSPGEWLLAGQVLTRLEMDVQAELALTRAIAHGDRSRLCLYGLGFVLHRQGRWSEALQCYGKALELGGDDPGLLSNMAMCEQRLRRFGRASAMLQRANRLAPADLSVLSRLVEVSAMRCAFDEERKYTALLDAALRRTDSKGQPDPLVATWASLSGDGRRKVFDIAAEGVQTARPQAIGRPSPGLSGGRLRIGYLSSDFCNHAVGRLFAGYVGDHDRERVHVHAYSLRRSEDAVANAIRGQAETFRELEGQSAQRVADAIRADGIDLLVDLNGYTFGGRPEVLAARPARRQVGYLGLIDDHRAPWLDAIIMDPVVAPARVRQAFMNKVLDLPGTMFPPALDLQGEGEAWSREDAGIPSDAFLMCSFANAYKIDRLVLQSWVGILRKVDTGVLLLHADGEAATSLADAWAALGGPRERLVLVGRSSTGEYLARLRACDLMLDTFRYGGGATSVDAIMQGLPILTLAGANPVARMSASLNHFLGMDALLAANPDDYVARAVAAAGSAGTLRTRVSEAVEQSGFRRGRRIASGLEELAFRWSGQS